MSVYDTELEFLFIDHLHDEKLVRREGITSYFIRKYIYLAFFGQPAKIPGPGASTQEQDHPDGVQTNQSPAELYPEVDMDLFVRDMDLYQGQTDGEDMEQREQEQREREQREQEQ